ncbi:hypothetical protein FD755_002401 [Muntiacus reevesi]|uniref:Protein kish n=1 Tax=Muntiacus reevesi TaxID=9886 RepID=A0A5J5N448_MUNRE|nr:hypothetical protein FD755_002401 [Muntiacus reevesi]
MSAIFNFQSLLTVILLLICTCAYIRSLAPSLLDRNKTGLATQLNNFISSFPFSAIPCGFLWWLSKIACLFLHFKVYMIQLAV